jgi:hypothetical protein
MPGVKTETIQFEDGGQLYTVVIGGLAGMQAHLTLPRLAAILGAGVARLEGAGISAFTFEELALLDVSVMGRVLLEVSSRLTPMELKDLTTILLSRSFVDGNPALTVLESGNISPFMGYALLYHALRVTYGSFFSGLAGAAKKAAANLSARSSTSSPPGLAGGSSPMSGVG